MPTIEFEMTPEDRQVIDRLMASGNYKSEEELIILALEAVIAAEKTKTLSLCLQS